MGGVPQREICVAEMHYSRWNQEKSVKLNQHPSEGKGGQRTQQEALPQTH